MKILRYLLFPISFLYGLVTSIRNILFDLKIFKKSFFNIPIIAVGNLSMGGTGKTPQIEYLISLLKANHKISVLSRGYNRNTRDFILLNESSTSQEVGDEPLQYFNKFNNINVAVDTDRVNGISNLIAFKNPTVILLDDAYQHRKVKASFYILLTKYNDLFIDDFLFPTGNLRESKKGVKRADIIIITKCPKNITEFDKKDITKRLSKFNKPIFFTYVSYANKTMGSQSISNINLKEYEVLLITGIADSTPLLNHLNNLNVNYNHLNYSDHHNFSDKEINQIKKNFSEIKNKNKIILTTEKDYSRLKNKLNDLNYLPIETKFSETLKDNFDKIIIKHIEDFS